MIGIPGWKINASSGQINLVQETNGDGQAYFRNLIPGQWTVQEETRNGWMPAAGYSDTIALDAPAPLVPHTCQPVVFVNKQVHTGCIAPKKVDDQGTPVSGWTFNLRNKKGTYQSPSPQVTDSSGVTYFTNLPLGEWVVEELIREDQQPWWNPTGPTTQEINLNQANGLCTQPIFTNERTGVIAGYKINHLEEGLMGWRITATNDETGEVRETTTNFDGYFRFDNLPFGTWTLEEHFDGKKKDIWTPVTTSSFKVEVDTQYEEVLVRFKNRTEWACVNVIKRDSFDNFGLAQWEIRLKPAYSSNPADTETAFTDGTGVAYFEGLAPGEWMVSEVMQDGWAADDPAVFETKFLLENSGSCSTIILYNHQTNQKPAAIVPFDPRTPTAPGGPGTGPVNNTCSQYYTIVRGDTLSSIARRFGVTVERLREVNNISNPNLIHPNTKLCIPIK